MIRLSETAHSDLKCIDATAELHNSTILSLVEQCMPSLMLQEWVQLVVNECSKKKFDNLLPFLHSWKLRIEYQNTGIRKLSPHQSSSQDTSTINVRKCLIHRDCNHPVWRCRVFRSLSSEKRFDIVKSAGACTLCLETGHTIAACPKPFKCLMPGCNASHNSLLHGETVKSWFK